MSVSTYEDLLSHMGHKIVCVGYGCPDGVDTVNVAVECETCNVVLMDFNRPEHPEPNVPYPMFCLHPDKCEGLGCCPRNPTCAD